MAKARTEPVTGKQYVLTLSEEEAQALDELLYSEKWPGAEGAEETLNYIEAALFDALHE